MKKQSTTQGGRRRRAGCDGQVTEFERRDLGSDIRTAGVGCVLRRRSKATSILLDGDLVARPGRRELAEGSVTRRCSS